MKAQRAITPIKSSQLPYNGDYLWWLNANNAIYSTSSGIDYIDEIPLSKQTQKFQQTTAIDRPELSRQIDNQLVIDTSNVMVPAKMYLEKSNTDKLFPSATGTFSFLIFCSGSSGTGQSIFLNSAGNGSYYNMQFSINTGGNLLCYTSTDFSQTLDTNTFFGSWSVVHFALIGTQMDYYRNGVYKNTFTINENFANSYPMIIGNYSLINAEQYVGYLNDFVSSGTYKNSTEISDNYNWYKNKYPSLP